MILCYTGFQHTEAIFSAPMGDSGGTKLQKSMRVRHSRGLHKTAPWFGSNVLEWAGTEGKGRLASFLKHSVVISPHQAPTLCLAFQPVSSGETASCDVRVGVERGETAHYGTVLYMGVGSSDVCFLST